MDIEIRRGLAEARVLAGEHKGALAAYAALGVVLPFLLLSSEPIFNLRTVMAVIAAPYASHISGSVTGPLYLLGIVSVLVAGAMLAAWNAILAEMREGYISEIMYGMVAGFAYLVANIILYVALVVVAILPVLLTGGIGVWSQIADGWVLEGYRMLLSLLGTWVGARFCLAGAIMGSRGKLEPFSAFLESWRLTRGAQWRLFGFYFGYGLVIGIGLFALVLLHGKVIWNNAQAPGSLLETAMSFGWVLLFAGYFLGQVLFAAGFLRAAQPATVAAEVFA